MFQTILREKHCLPEDLIQHCILPYLLPSREQTNKKMKAVMIELCMIVPYEFFGTTSMSRGHHALKYIRRIKSDRIKQPSTLLVLKPKQNIFPCAEMQAKLFPCAEIEAKIFH
jgi:hypothetical protein